jgi:hypothetical protein
MDLRPQRLSNARKFRAKFEAVKKKRQQEMTRKPPVEEAPPPPPPTRDSFKKYLDDGCILDLLARIIVALSECPQFPADPQNFITRYVGTPHGVNVDSIRQENADLKDEVQRLEQRAQELKTQLGISE